MTRLPNWVPALDEFLRVHRSEQFEYGAWDCCLFVCDAIRAMTGVDVAGEFRGTYSCRTEALGAIRRVTGRGSVRSVVAHVTAAYGMPKITVRKAQRGDLVMLRRSNDSSLGIVALNGTDAIVLTANGFTLIPLSNAASAWRV